MTESTTEVAASTPVIEAPVVIPSAPDNGVKAPPENPLALFERFKDEIPQAPAQEKKEEVEAPKVQKDPVKTVKAVAETGEIELPENAKFRAKVENEDIEFTVKDAVNSYKTSKQIARDFSKLDVEKKTVKKEKEEVQTAKAQLAFIDQNLRLIQDEAQKGNIMGVMQIVLAMGGGDHSEQTKTLIKQAEELAIKLSDMSEEEKEVFFGKEELAAKKKKFDAESAQFERNKKLGTLGMHVEKLKADHKVTDEDLNNALETLLAKNHPMPEDPIGVANVCTNWVLATRQYDKICSAIKRVDATKVTDLDFINSLADVIDPAWSEDEVTEVVDGILKHQKNSAKATVQDSTKGAETGSANQNGASPENATPQKVATTQMSEAEKDSGRPILRYEDLIARYDGK